MQKRRQKKNKCGTWLMDTTRRTKWNKARIAQLDDVLLRTLRSGGSSRVPVRRGRRNPRSPPPSLPAAGGQRCGPGEEEEGGSRARRSGPTEGAGDPPGPGARTWPRKWVAGSGERRGSAWPGSSALSRSAAPRNAPRPRAPRSAARGGAMARGGGGKAGSLKDKLDGNELDLSLCDLSEVPVRELVSGWREGRCRLVPPPPAQGLRGELRAAAGGGRAGLRVGEVAARFAPPLSERLQAQELCLSALQPGC